MIDSTNKKNNRVWRHGSFLLSVVAISSILLSMIDSCNAQESLTGVYNQAFYDKVKTGEYQKIGDKLGLMVETVAEFGTLDSLPEVGYDVYTFEGGDHIMVDVVFESTVIESLDDAVSLLGDDFEKLACYSNVCSGFALISALPAMSNSEDIIFIKPAYKGATRKGSVTSQGDAAMKTDEARSTFEVDGTGVTIGVLSDSYDFLGGESDGIASEDLPADVNVLQDLLLTGVIDEGRGMIELIHDVAPGAKLAFHTALTSQTIFAQGIENLAKDAECDVIVDDIGYPDEPFFIDGIVAQAIDNVFDQGKAYFSAAGNDGVSAWHTDAGFLDSGSTFEGSKLHNFVSDGRIDVIQNFIAPRSGVYRFVLQWDEPWASATGGTVGSTSDLDLYLSQGENVIESSTTENVGKDAVEVLTKTLEAGEQYGISIALKSGNPPRYMKWLTFNTPRISLIEHAVLSGTSFGHVVASGGAGVAAADYRQTPEFNVDPAVHEAFSSRGEIPLFFDKAGNRLATSETRQQPRFTGPDGAQTTFFGVERDGVGNGFFFFGTSAAAPHVAAIAALMLERNKDLKPTEIFDILQKTALDMDDQDKPDFQEGFDFRTGFGFVDGLAAVTAAVDSPVPAPAPIPGPAPAPAPQAPIPAPVPATLPAPAPSPVAPAPVPSPPVPAPTPVTPPAPAPTPVTPPAPAPSPVIPPAPVPVTPPAPLPAPAPVPSPTLDFLPLKGTIVSGTPSDLFTLTNFDDSDVETLAMFEFVTTGVTAGSVLSCELACTNESETSTKILSLKAGRRPTSLYDDTAFKVGKCPVSWDYTIETVTDLYVIAAGFDGKGLEDAFVTCVLALPST